MTGVYCFDLYVREVRKRGIKIILQYHDEILFPIKRGVEHKVDFVLKESIEEVNKIVQLNVPLNISIDYGNTYAEVH